MNSNFMNNFKIHSPHSEKNSPPTRNTVTYSALTKGLSTNQ